ncbi:DedA family protein [Luteolibacter ambystomatis]|uniref:DedA family protein n=1 Tax=Luteolibacter ambystomatis TaxID=2824561 RepID=A0A975J0C7_9BACT|nr:DedA family protein [Luteolibacter ambystomatis]QUE51693.1 DedA family protein [Luteolibacter ambystomatis]
MKEILDFFLHLQDHLHDFTRDHGSLVYGLLFLIVFCETGLVITPFLPGDSLLFAIGAISANEASGLNVWIAAVTLLAAAAIGDTTNYWIGRTLGKWLTHRFPKIVKPSYLEKTHRFYDTYGAKTLIMARFVPIVRTFAPFVAGSGAMPFRKFILFSCCGSLLWVGLILPAGWFLGDKPFVKNNFEIVVLAIIGISLLPMVIELLRAKLRARNKVAGETAE